MAEKPSTMSLKPLASHYATIREELLSLVQTGGVSGVVLEAPALPGPRNEPILRVHDPEAFLLLLKKASKGKWTFAANEPSSVERACRRIGLGKNGKNWRLRLAPKAKAAATTPVACAVAPAPAPVPTTTTATTTDVGAGAGAGGSGSTVNTKKRRRTNSTASPTTTVETASLDNFVLPSTADLPSNLDAFDFLSFDPSDSPAASSSDGMPPWAMEPGVPPEPVHPIFPPPAATATATPPAIPGTIPPSTDPVTRSEFQALDRRVERLETVPPTSIQIPMRDPLDNIAGRDIAYWYRLDPSVQSAKVYAGDLVYLTSALTITPHPPPGQALAVCGFVVAPTQPWVHVGMPAQSQRCLYRPVSIKGQVPVNVKPYVSSVFGSVTAKPGDLLVPADDGVGVVPLPWYAGSDTVVGQVVSCPRPGVALAHVFVPPVQSGPRFRSRINTAVSHPTARRVLNRMYDLKMVIVVALLLFLLWSVTCMSPSWSTSKSSAPSESTPGPTLLATRHSPALTVSSPSDVPKLDSPSLVDPDTLSPPSFSSSSSSSSSSSLPSSIRLAAAGGPHGHGPDIVVQLTDTSRS